MKNKNKVWIVEAKFANGLWDVCDFGLKKFCSTSYHEAHHFKRKQQACLNNHGSKLWTPDCFRVVEYGIVVS